MVEALPPFEVPSPKRSRNMAAIRSKGTKPEMMVRRAIHAAGFRYRLHRREIPGNPDLAFQRYRLAVFVHGCFWHGHSCGLGHVPKTNTAYWRAKIARNVQRDAGHLERLAAAGWQVFVVRECSLGADVLALLEALRTLKAQTPIHLDSSSPRSRLSDDAPYHD
jgi:DNA mismatch endonuclease (patch repair protein)